MSEMYDLLPHREPFLYVDRIESVDEKQIIGYRRFTDADYFFKGHFPEYPVVPGVILIETMAQCGGAGLKKGGAAAADALFLLASVEKAKFRKQVRPGDEVKIVIENERVAGRMIKQKGRCFVGDDLAAEASWLCLAGTKEDL